MANPRSRPLIIGPDSGPEAPYPLQMEGEVIKGFGRGSKEASQAAPLSLHTTLKH